MKEAIQKKCYEIGKSGCYFLSILRQAEIITGRTYNPIEEYEKSLEKNYIGEDCFVKQPAKILSDLTGMNFTVSKQNKNYALEKNEYEVLYFVNDATGHFVLGDGKGNVLFDPYGKSKTVKEGAIESKRVFHAEAER